MKIVLVLLLLGLVVGGLQAGKAIVRSAQATAAAQQRRIEGE